MAAKSANAATVGLLLSGGLDSGILLGHLLESGRRVQPFYVRSRLVWETAELQGRASASVRPSVLRRWSPWWSWRCRLRDLYGDHWSITGRHTPEADSRDEAVYLPGRNALLTIKPRPVVRDARHRGVGPGRLASNPFADATDEFFRDFQAALERATGSRVQPDAALRSICEKTDVMELGRGLPLELTFSCIAPVGRPALRPVQQVRRTAAGLSLHRHWMIRPSMQT